MVPVLNEAPGLFGSRARAVRCAARAEPRVLRCRDTASEWASKALRQTVWGAVRGAGHHSNHHRIDQLRFGGREQPRDIVHRVKRMSIDPREPCGLPAEACHRAVDPGALDAVGVVEEHDPRFSRRHRLDDRARPVGAAAIGDNDALVGGIGKQASEQRCDVVRLVKAGDDGEDARRSGVRAHEAVSSWRTRLRWSSGKKAMRPRGSARAASLKAA